MSARPFEELERVFDRMSDEIDSISRSWTAGDGGSAAMPLDLVDRDDAFVVTADMPGFEIGDVSIRVSDHTLHIEADREERLDTESERVLRHERSHQMVQRDIRLPAEVDKDGVEAKMHNGVLTITLPKVASAEARSIEIKAED